jgi:hypothetical protein
MVLGIITNKDPKKVPIEDPTFFAWEVECEDEDPYIAFSRVVSEGCRVVYEGDELGAASWGFSPGDELLFQL